MCERGEVFFFLHFKGEKFAITLCIHIFSCVPGVYVAFLKSFCQADCFTDVMEIYKAFSLVNLFRLKRLKLTFQRSSSFSISEYFRDIFTTVSFLCSLVDFD